MRCTLFILPSQPTPVHHQDRLSPTAKAAIILSYTRESTSRLDPLRNAELRKGNIFCGEHQTILWLAFNGNYLWLKRKDAGMK